MRRRPFLIGSAGVIGGLAGCAGVLDDSDGGGEDENAIVEPLRQYVDFAGDGEREAARACLHPNGTWAESEAEVADLLDHNNATLADADVVDRSGDRATVEMTVRDYPESESSLTYTQTIQVRTHEGEWLVYGDPDDESVREPRPPRTRFEVEERTDEDGRTTAVAFVHHGGDSIDVATLRVAVGEAVVGPEEGGILTTGYAVVAPFPAGGDGYDAGTTVALEWHAPSSEDTATITSHDLESESAGELGTTLQVE